MHLGMFYPNVKLLFLNPYLQISDLYFKTFYKDIVFVKVEKASKFNKHLCAYMSNLHANVASKIRKENGQVVKFFLYPFFWFSSMSLIHTHINLFF